MPEQNRYGQPLTPRQVSVLDHFAEGDTYEETAKALGLSVQTVKRAAYGAYIRLGARSAAHAVKLRAAA